MGESIINSTFQFARPVSDKEISEIIHLLSELEGIEKANVSEMEVAITYDGYVQTEELLRNKLEEAGYKILDKSYQSKGWFQKMVDYISKGNKEAFKGGQPNCCNPDTHQQN